MSWLDYVNLGIAIIFFLCYSYQIVYLILSLFKKPIQYPDAPKDKKYAILISARNEEDVIGYLLDSINEQDYPKEQITAFVCADNCTDKTAKVAKEHGAHVYERFNQTYVGKGYALNYMTHMIWEEFGQDAFDAYIVIDADNLLMPNYVTEMNKCFSAGNPLVTGYRNTKNYGDNWVAAGSGLWFLHEARQLNIVRSRLGLSCAVSGTGFMVAKEILKRNDGWKHYLLTEDVEFSIDCIMRGEKIAYCHSAMLFDEQPVKFKQSLRQRLRWSKGFLQIQQYYLPQIIKSIFGKGGFSSFDILMNLAPAYLLTTVSIVCNVVGIILALIVDQMGTLLILRSIAQFLFSLYWFAFVFGTLCVAFEWKNIQASKGKKIWSCFTFPVYMLTYIPISFVAIFKKVSWKPIVHTRSYSLKTLQNGSAPVKKKEKS